MRTDRAIESNPHFHRWDYRGNALQRRLGIGPRKAIYDPVVSDAIVQALNEQDEGALTAMKMAFASGTQVYDTQAAKTVGPTRWWIEFAEGQLHKGFDALYKSSSWVYRCVDIRAQTLAQTPWSIVKGETEVEGGVLFDLLTNVNPEANWGDLIAGTESDLCVFGHAYWLKVDGPFLQRLNAKHTEPIKGSKGIAGFRYHGPQVIEYPREQVVYFHTYNPVDEYVGLSPLGVCRNAIEVDAQANQHMADFFENRAMPAYIFSMDTQDQNELNRASKLWEQMYGGKGKQFKTAFVGGGGKPVEMGYAPEQLALKDVREEARKSICSALGVPPVLVGAWEAANYATADEQRSSLYTETLIPRGEYIASVINAELAPDFGDEQFEWAWEELDVMQEDKKVQAERLGLLVEKQIIKPEVAAEELGYDPGDVPEPKPVPEMLQPFVGDSGRPKPDDEFPEQLAKWHKKAANRLKDGKSPAVVFKSDVIDHRLGEYILGGLEQARTVTDVARVFERAKTWRGYP